MRFSAERSAYEAQILQLQHKVQEYENQIGQLLAEIDRVSAQSLEKMREVDSLKAKVTHGEDKYKLELSEARSQLEYFKATNYVHLNYLFSIMATFFLKGC